MPRRIQKIITYERYHVVSVAKKGMRIFWTEGDYGTFMRMVSRYSTGRVQVMIFGLVGNHGHFLLKQICDGGVEKFMSILQRQYSRAKGFPGSLFKSPFRAERIADEDHYYRVLAYILRNPGKYKMVNLGRDGRSGLMIE